MVTKIYFGFFEFCPSIKTRILADGYTYSNRLIIDRDDGIIEGIAVLHRINPAIDGTE